MMWLESVMRETAPFADRVDTSVGKSWVQQVRDSLDNALNYVPSAAEINKAARLRRLQQIRGIG